MRKLETVNISKIKKENYQTITFASKQYLQKSPMVITLNGKYFHLKYPKGWNELKLFSISSITIIPEVPGRTIMFSSVAQSCPTLCNLMNRSTPGLPVHHKLPEFTYNPCPLYQWCHPTISSSVVPFSSWPQSFPTSGSFLRSQFFASGGQSIGASASTSVIPGNTQDWSPLGWTAWISLQLKGLSRVFSNTTVQKHQFFGTQLSL